MPRAPKARTSCATPGCPELSTDRGRCAAHAVKPWAGSNRGSTRAWRTMRAQVLAEEPTCRDCGAPSTDAGHIIPKAYGGTDDRNNLKGQCTPCNGKQIVTDRLRCATPGTPSPGPRADTGTHCRFPCARPEMIGPGRL